MKNLITILLLVLSIGASAQERIISGQSEQPAGISTARQWVYFNSPAGEFTNFDIIISTECSGVIYNYYEITLKDFAHHYQLPATGITYHVIFACYNSATGSTQMFSRTIYS